MQYWRLTFQESVTNLAKGGTLGKVRLTWQSSAHFAKCGTPTKMQHTWQSAEHLAKCGTLSNTFATHLPRKGTHLPKNGTHGKVGQTWKIAALLKMLHT